MAGMNVTKFDNIYKLLTEYNFEISGNLPEALKCVQCKRLLNNPFQVQCGCRFCCCCIDNLRMRGCQNCIGMTNECKDEILSNAHLDYSANREISKLLVKCPDEMCPYECELRSMEEHVRLCTKKIVKCPFYGLGCEMEKLATCQIYEHFQTKDYHHSKILVDVITNMKNEFSDLKNINEKNQNAINVLNENIVEKDEKIQSMIEEINLLKLTNQNLNNQIDTFMSNSSNKIEENVTQTNPEPNRTLVQVEPTVNDDKWKYKMGFLAKEMKKTDDAKPKFAWECDKMAEMKWIGGECSEYFYPQIASYKMRLEMTNYLDNVSSGVCVRLCLYPGPNDAELRWPFQGHVTIRITNNALPDTYKCITKHCRIRQSNCPYNRSDPFYFPYSDLTTTGTLLGGSFLIECFLV